MSLMIYGLISRYRSIIFPSPGMSGYVFFVGAERDTPSGHWEWVNGQLVDELSYV